MEGILSGINGPEDLNRLDTAGLNALAAELREEILKVVSTNGGHLAPNLGVVELTLAIHSVFSSPRDQIIWDVGHQSYVHKLLTGRRESFHSLRTMGGLSGFPKPFESEHDHFATGHSSTSISAALGMACARDLLGADNHVIAVIGDGSLTGGMAFEALNHAGHLGKPLIVILNDNEMSIAQNVGALSQYLNRLRMDPRVKRVKEDISALLGKVPAVGNQLVRFVHRVKDSIKYLVVPGMLFEELGFTYLGPIDGHDIDAVKRTLEEAKLRDKPVLVHAITIKGKGYRHAEESPERFHGTGPFDLATGIPKSQRVMDTYTDVFSRTMIELGKNDPRIVGITAAMPDGTGLSQFARAFPSRFFDVGIAEQHAVTFAAGLATKGYKPVFAVYSSFAQRAYDQLLHDVCLQKLPVIIILDRAGLVGQDGPTHNGVYDISFTRHMPNITVMAPCDGSEFHDMLNWAVSWKGPVVIRVPKSDIPVTEWSRALSGDNPDEMRISRGRSQVIRAGSRIAVLAVGSMVDIAADVCDRLAGKGVEPSLINVRFIKPIDSVLIGNLTKTHDLLVTLEEHVLEGGFGSSVLEVLEEAGLRSDVLRIGLSDKPYEHGTREQLLVEHGLSPDRITARILEHQAGKANKTIRKHPNLHLATK